MASIILPHLLIPHDGIVRTTRASVASQAVTDPSREVERKQRIASSVTSFIETTRDSRTLIALGASDSVLVINATMLSGDDGSRCGFFLYTYDASSYTIRPLRRAYLRYSNYETASTRLSAVALGREIVEQFAITADSSTIAIQLQNVRGVLWIASLTSGAALHCIEDFQQLGDDSRLLFTWCGSSGLRNNLICVSATCASYISLWRVCEDIERATCVRDNLGTEEHVGIRQLAHVCSIHASATSVVAAFTDGFVGIWSIEGATFGKTRNLPFVCQQVCDKKSQVVNLLERDQAEIDKRNLGINVKMKIGDREDEDLRSWVRQLDDKCIRFILYLLEDGQVIDVAVGDTFDLTFVTLDAVEMIAQHGLDLAKSPGLEQILLQPDRVLRVAFLACLYRIDGIFAQKSMNELIGDIRDEEIMLKKSDDFDRFLAGYSDTVSIQVRRYYRVDDSDQCVLSLGAKLDARQQDPNRQSVLLCHVGSMPANDGRKNALKWWIYSNDIGSPTPPITSKERSALEAEAFRLRQHSILSEREKSIAHIQGVRNEILISMKRILSEAYSCHENEVERERVAESLLSYVQELCWLTMVQIRLCDPIEAFFASELFADRSELPRGEFVNALKVIESRRLEFTPWIQRLRSSTLKQSDEPSISKHEVVRHIRRLRCGFLSIDLFYRVLLELDVLSHVFKTVDPLSGEAFSLFQQYLSSFSLSHHGAIDVRGTNDVDSGYHDLLTFIHPMQAVAFILKECDVGVKIDRCVDLISDRLREAKAVVLSEFTCDASATAEHRYAQLISHERVFTNINAVERRQLMLSEHGIMLDASVSTSARHQLRFLLKTSLPALIPRLLSVAVSVPTQVRRFGERFVINAEGAISENAHSSLHSISIVVCKGGDTRSFQIEGNFYRRIQGLKARDLFLPIIPSAFTLPVQGSERLPEQRVTYFVCDSLERWITIQAALDCIKRSGYISSLAHWQMLLLHWGRQVLLALIALDDDGNEVTSIHLEDVMVSPDCKQVRLLHLNSFRRQSTDKSRISIAVYGLFLLELCTCLDQDQQINVGEFLAEDIVADHDKGKYLVALLMEIWARHDASWANQSESRAIPDIGWISHQLQLKTGSSNYSLVCLVSAAILALYPVNRVRSVSLMTLWGVSFASSPEEAPDSTVAELSCFLSIYSDLEERLLLPLRYFKNAKSFDTSTGTLLSGGLFDCAQDLLLDVLGLPKHSSSWARPLQLVFVRRLLSETWFESVASAAVYAFQESLAAGCRDTANNVVQTTTAFLTSLLEHFDDEVSLTDLLHIDELQDLVSRLILALWIMCGYPHTTKFSIRATTAYTLWRLGETSLQCFIGESPEHTRYRHIRHFLGTVDYSLTATMNVDMKKSFYPVASIWWQPRSITQPELLPQRLSSLYTSQQPHTVSLRLLQVVYSLLELRFNACGAASAPLKYRLAALQGCFSAQYLERSTAPLMIARDVTVDAWQRLDFVATLSNLLRDADDRIAYGAMSIIEMYTRVLRYHPLGHPKPDLGLEQHIFRGISNPLHLAVEIAKCRAVLTEVVNLLTRQVRQLKILGDAGVSAPISSRYGSSSSRVGNPAALLCVTLAFLVNCLYGGDNCTYIWPATGVCGVVLTHAKSKAVDFVRVVDANWGYTTSTNSTNSNAWPVFTTPSPRGNTKMSPFVLLLQETIEPLVASRNPILIQYLQSSSALFRKLVEEYPSTKINACLHLVSSPDYGRLNHVWDTLRDIDEYDGTVDEKTHAVEYASTVIRLVLASSTNQLASVERMCVILWQWMDIGWRGVIEGGKDASERLRHGAVLVAIIRMAHNIAQVRNLKTSQRERIFTFSDDESGRSTLFHALLAHIRSAIRRESDQGPIISSLCRASIELLLGLVELSPFNDEDRASDAMKNLIGVRDLLRLLMTDTFSIASCMADARSSSGSLQYTLRLKVRLWASMLRICDREVARIIVDEEVFDHFLSHLADNDIPLQNDDSFDEEEAARAVNGRLEAVAMLEEFQRWASGNRAHDSLAQQLLVGDIVKTLLQRRTIQTERQKVLSVRYQRTHSTASPLTRVLIPRMIATAKRLVQLAICLAVNPTMHDEADAAVVDVLADVGVPIQVVEWHQETGPCVEETEATKAVREFWKLWPEESAPVKPQSSMRAPVIAVRVPQTKNVHIEHKKTRNTRAPMSPQVKVRFLDALVSTDDAVMARDRVTVKMEKSRSIPASKQETSTDRMPLDELLACLGQEIAPLEAIFCRFATPGPGNSRTLDPRRLCAVLKECKVPDDSLSHRDATPMTFSQFLLEYARWCGLEELWRFRSKQLKQDTCEYVWLSSGQWVVLPSAISQELQSAVTDTENERIGVEKLVEILQRLHHGIFTRAELLKLIRDAISTMPTREHAAPDSARLTPLDTRRAAAVVHTEASKRPTMKRLVLPATSPRQGGLQVSPVRVDSEMSRAMKTQSPERPSEQPRRGSVVQTLLSIDFESAVAMDKQTERVEKKKKKTEEKKNMDAKAEPKHESDGESLGSDAYSPYSSSSDTSETKPTGTKHKKNLKEKKKKQDEKKHLSSSDSDSDSGDGQASSGSSDTEQQQAARPSAHEAEARKREALLRRVFAKYDADGDGVISFTDLRRVVGARYTQFSNVELQRWIAEKDRRGVGAVDFADFVHAFAGAVGVDADAQPVGADPGAGGPERRGTEPRRVVLSSHTRIRGLRSVDTRPTEETRTQRR